MSAVAAARSNRPGKEKVGKPVHTQTPPKAEGAASKNQPTAEQMRIAQMITDKNDHTDPQMLKKINQVMELTGKNEDEVTIALHDCDGDPNRAANMLLEGGGDQGEWVTTEKKKKRNQPSSTPQDENTSNHRSDHREEKSREREPKERSESSNRGSRIRSGMPPRLARGRGKENDDSQSRERSFDRGRGRGRGQMNGPGRGRGRGARRFERGGKFEKGPRIDTWTNETAEVAEKDNNTWDLQVEDWTADEWQGSLEESKVFTAKQNTDSKFFPPPGVGDNDASMFQPPPPNIPLETTVFTNSMVSTATNGGMGLSDGSNSLNHPSPMPPAPGLHQPPLGQRLGLGMLGLNDKSGGEAPGGSTSQQQSQFMSQFAKQATESIKNAVGIGSSPPANQSANTAVTQPSQPTPPVGQNQQQSSLQQQRKPQRTKLPPPSKIPASAVEMPGHMVGFPLDVQFGNWDLSNETSAYASYANSADSVSSGAIYSGSSAGPGANMNSMSHMSSSKPDMPTSVMTNVTSSTSPSVGGLESLSQSVVANQRTGVFSNSSPSTTPTKDFSQSNKLSSPPDPIPFPTSQTDRNSPYSGQRQTQTPGSLGSSASSSPSQMAAFSQPGYSSSYPTSSFKSGGLSSSTGGSLSSSTLQGSQSQYGPQSYQASSFQSQGSFTSGQNSSSLYQNTNSVSSFSGQPGAYQSQSSGSYSSRDAQSTYQPGVSQSSSSYQTGNSQSGSSYPNVSSHGSSQSGSSFQGSVSQPTGSSFQTDSQGRPSSYGSQVSYGGSSHQSSLPGTAMSTSKLSDSLSKISVKDSTALDSQSSQFDSSTTGSSSLTTTTTTTSSSLTGTSVSVSATIGLSTPSTSSVPSTTNTSASAKVATFPTSKAPPGVPPGVPPLIGASYLMGQPGTVPFAAAAFANLAAAQQPMYGYEDLQLLQQRLPLPGYYDMQFQPTTTLAAGRDQAALSSVPYTGADGKLNRVEAQSPVQGQTTQAQQTVSAHQQTFINAAGALPAYSYYYPGAGILPGGYSYTPAVFPVPSVTNTGHAGTNANAQFQKANAYSSHTYGTGYDDLTGQDFAKAYGAASQTTNKVSSGSASSATDLTGAGYGKTHSQGFEKAGFHTNTPPPYNLPGLPTGTQAGPMGGPAAAYTPYVPMMAQPHSQMLHHQLQHDSTGGSSRGSQSASQGKTAATKNYATGYWGTN